MGFLFAARRSDRNSRENRSETVRVVRGRLVRRTAETGVLEPGRVVEIKSEQSGEVKEIFVHAGDSVKRGEPLAEIQQESNQARQAAQFRANVEHERLNLEEAERELSRVGELHERGFVARREVEVAQMNRENAKIRYDLARRQLLLILGGNQDLFEKYLKRDLASDEMEKFILSSPLSGTVLEVKITEGEIVSSGTSTVTGGTSLMRIADLSQILVKTKINEVTIGQIALGQPAEVRLDAIPGVVYQGRVSKISPRGEKAVNNVVTYEVVIELSKRPPGELVRLMPGMTANVDIITGELAGALLVPVAALSEDGQVLVRGEDGAPVPRKVRIGMKTEMQAAVEEGLSEGEELFLRRKERLRAD